MSKVDFYVSTAGNLSAVGTVADPFFSLKEAVAAVKQSEEKEFAIHVEGGEYHMVEAVVIDREGLEGKTLTITAEENTIFSGTEKIAPVWQKYDDNIFVAQIGKNLMFDALYAGDEKQILARYPNYEAGAILGGYSNDAISEKRVARWRNPEGGYIRALHDREWGSNSYIVTGKSNEGELEYSWVGDNNRGNQMHKVKRMVENIFEELDCQGEWFYEKNSGELFFYPPSDLELSGAEFTIAVNSQLIKIVGKSQINPISNIEINNIKFRHTHRTLFTGKYERPLRGDWGFVRSGVVYIENSENVLVKDCSFDDIGGNAVTISGYNKNIVVVNSKFTGIGATGVLITGIMNAVRDASTYDNENHKTVIRDFVQGPADENYPRDILVSNNYFYDIGTVEKQTAAVCMSISQDVTVSHNTVHHTSRAGINVHDGTFGGHIIEHNDLFDCVTETSDHGPINCWGRDRFWSVPQHDAMGYYGKEKRPFALLDAVKTSTIRNNRVHANHAFGIDIDDGASNYDIYNNLCIGVGIKLRDGFDRKVHNNLLINSGLEIHMSFAANNDLIYTNVILNSNVCNSLCVNEGATTFFANNVYWNNGNELSNLPENDHGSIVACPQISNLEENDFALREDSPAIKKGFLNFPMKDKDFGVEYAPNPPKYVYVDVSASEETHLFHDVLLSNITGEGIRSAAGLPDLKGVYIAQRDVLGLFCKLGLPIGVGDVIRKIDGASINDIEDFLSEFEKIPLRLPIEIEFFRSQLPHKLIFVKETDDYLSIKEEAMAAWQGESPLLYKSEDYTSKPTINTFGDLW